MNKKTWLAAILIAAMFLGICLPLATSVAWAQSTPPASVDGVLEVEPAKAGDSQASLVAEQVVTAAADEQQTIRYTWPPQQCGGWHISSGASRPGPYWAQNNTNMDANAVVADCHLTFTPPGQGWVATNASTQWWTARIDQDSAQRRYQVESLGIVPVFAWQTNTGQEPSAYDAWHELQLGWPATIGGLRMVAFGGSADWMGFSDISLTITYRREVATPTLIPATATSTPPPTNTPTPRPTNTPWPTYTPTPSKPWSGQTPKWGIYLDPTTGKPKLGRFDWVVATYGRKLYLASVTGGNMVASADLNAVAATATPTPGNWQSGQKTIYRFDGETDAWVEVPTSNQDEFAIAGTMAVVGLGLLGDDVTVIGVVDDPIAIVMLATATGYAVYGIYRDFTEPDIWVSGPDDLLDLTHSLSTGEGLEVNPRSVYVVGDEGVIETRFDWKSRPSDAVWATTYLYASEVGLAHEPAGVLGTMSFWRDGQEREFYLSVGLPDVPALPDALPLPEVIEKLIGKRYKDVELPVGWPTVGPHEGPDPHGRSQEELETRRQQRAPGWATVAQKAEANVANGKPPCDWLGYVPERDACYCACYTCVLQAAVDGIKDITGIIQIFSGQAGMQNTAIPLGSGGIPKGWQPGDITRQPTGGQYQPRVVVRDAETKAPILDADGNPVTRPGPRTVDQRNTSDPDYQRCNSLINNKWGPPAAPAAAALGWSEVQP